MIPEKSFNKEINSFLKLDNSDAKHLILELTENIKIKSYYIFFDEICERIGISLIALPIINDNDKIIAYRPIIRYCYGNTLNETPREERLSDPVSESICYKYLTKALIYRLTKVNNLKDLVQKQNFYKL